MKGIPILEWGWTGIASSCVEASWRSELPRQEQAGMQIPGFPVQCRVYSPSECSKNAKQAL